MTSAPCRSPRSHNLNWPFLLLLFLALFHFGTFDDFAAFGQPAPEIDRSTVRIDPASGITFQFQAPLQEATALVIEVTFRLASTNSWMPASGAQIVSVAQGLFRATVPLPGDRQFYRVRAIDSDVTGPSLLINEVMTDNVAAFDDGTGNFWDWIEIYNPNDDAVNLERYALTDDATLPGKWRFPGLLIQPHARVLVFASDLNRTNAAEALHANFKLKAGGETLILSDAQLRPLDELPIPALAPDQSLGRAPDGGGDMQFYAGADVSPSRANPATLQGAKLLPPTFTPDGGFFSQPLSVRIIGEDPNHILHYTVDGSAPTAQSPVLTSSLSLDKSAVVRVIAVDQQGRSSAPEARSYLIGVQHTLPVISLATAPSNLEFRDGYLYGLGPRVLSSQDQVLQSFPYSGSNAWRDREVEIAVEFFETNRTVGFRQRAGMKIFGGWGSRGYPQKSLALFARRSYGLGKFNYRIFPDLGVNEFEAFVLRGSGNDNQGTQQTPPRPPITEFGPTTTYGSYFVNSSFTLMRDALMQRLIEDTDLDTQAYRPAVVYVNGEYWGIFNIREKMNEAYVLSHHGLAPGSIDLIEGYGTANAGQGTVYTQMRQYLSTKNMADSANYAFVAENYLDIDNFIDYHLSVIYFQNFDIGNIKCWRPRTARGQFRWMVFDQDYGFNLWPAEVYVPAMARDYADYDNMFDFYTAGTGNSTAWPNAGGRTMMLRTLLNNPQFKERFIRRCADLLNSSFREEKVAQTILEMAAVIRPEIAAHLQRWSWSELTKRGFGKPHQPEFQPFTQPTWESNITVLSDFATNRPAKLRQDCLQHFKLKNGLGTLRLSVEPEGSARLALNSLTIEQLPWQGVYFADFPSTIQAIPKVGFRFVEWLTPAGTTNGPRLSLNVQGDSTNTVIARLETALPNTGAPSELSITEFQYHPPATRDTGDWVELSYSGTAPLQLVGWIFRDESDDHAFPLPDITLSPGAILVLCQDEFRFRQFHPATIATAGNFKFGLNNGGGTLRLFRPDGRLAWSVVYGDAAPWPTAADGNGSTLQLIDSKADPALSSSWKASVEVGGSPGRP